MDITLQELNNRLSDIVNQKNDGSSQFGEHNIIDEIFRHIDPTIPYVVDIGAGFYGHGTLSNTEHLLDKGWKGLFIDAKPALEQKHIKKYFVTPYNIVQIFQENNVPGVFALLSIDIDSFDLDVMVSILEKGYVPLVICTEYNGCLPPDQSLKLAYEEGYTWDETTKYGYSFAAGQKFAEKYGYRIVLNQSNMNLYMIHKIALQQAADQQLEIKAIQQHYHAKSKDAVFVNY